MSGQPSDLMVLIQNAQKGDSEAMNQLVDRFRNQIEQECKRFSLWEYPEWSHQDLTQEVLFRVWTRIEQFRGTDTSELPGVFRSWIRKTTRTVLINFFRYQSRAVRKPAGGWRKFDEDQAERNGSGKNPRTASSIFVSSEDAARLISMMHECLDDQSRQILLLRIVDGLTVKQIAEQLGLTFEQVRYKFDKSLGLLQKRFS